jgi:hypothetical protein
MACASWITAVAATTVGDVSETTPGSSQHPDVPSAASPQGSGSPPTGRWVRLRHEWHHRIDPDARRRRLTALVNAASLARETPAAYVVEDRVLRIRPTTRIDWDAASGLLTAPTGIGRPVRSYGFAQAVGLAV